MAINLAQLEQAAERFVQHAEAEATADPEVVKREDARKAELHEALFLPASEKLAKLKAQAARTLAAGRRMAAAPRALSGLERRRGVNGPDAPAVELPTAAVDAALFMEDGVVPEVLARDNDLRPVRFLQLALLVARSVGRIRIADGPITEEGDATGFLVAPGLLMTNRHVLKSAEFAAAASVVFDDEETLLGELKETTTFRLRPDLLFVNDESLDYAIVQVSPRSSSGVPLAQFGYLRLFKQTGKLDPNQREAANIIQHPAGGSKKIAIRDNYIHPVVPDGVDPAKRLNSMFYGTDTLRGSSGSPVCSDQWYVVALHRGGVPATRVIDGRRVVLRLDDTPAHSSDSSSQLRYLTNEGTRISRIYASLEEKSAAGDKDAEAALLRLLDSSRDPRTGPVDLRTAPLLLPLLPSEQLGGAEEIMRRKLDKFEGATGYRPNFLGNNRRVALPEETSEVQRELATLTDSTRTELKYDHYSLKINKERRTAFYVAANINGAQLWNNMDLGKRPDRPKWSYDPRMDDAVQPDDAIFSNAMQRGHLFKREDAGWGADRDAIVRADEHSFTITNATPMIGKFNNTEWGDLEDLVTRECEAGHKVSYFAGPVFRTSDPFFNELRAGIPAAERRQGMRVPETFWKVVAWVEDGELRSAGFMLSQKNEIAEHGPIEEELNFGTYRKTPITDIEQATGLRFPDLVAVDTFEQD